MNTTRTYDVVVLGGTPGGIASAVRAAREGADTALVTYNRHLGGMMAGGLSYTDTLMMKPRTPLFVEYRESVRDHYRSEYGVESDDYEACEDGYIAEPHVAEETFEQLVSGEPSLDVFRGYYPDAVRRRGDTLDSVVVTSFDEQPSIGFDAAVFVEATYEGDLMATAGADYRIGREGRAEYDEQFAGSLYTRTRSDRYYPQEAVGADVDPSAPADRRGPLDTPAEKRQGALDLVPHPAGISEIHPKSSGTGDDRIQAYNYRLCLTDDPDNRVRPERPDDYDRTEFVDVLDELERVGFRSLLRLRHLPNDKADMNTADLPGENYDYPEADWNRRREIADRHRQHALGLLYFLQNDEAVPSEVREAANEWGLAADEFVDNDHFPFQLYVREARRLDGRYTFTESDARHADGLDRTPIHRDSIAVAEYPLDSHACKPTRQFGSHPEGHFYASQVTRPANVPFRAVLPETIDNLLVPVPLSASHVGYGSIRLEPTWIHVGESVGYAASMAVDQEISPANLSVSTLQSRLVEDGVMLSFFNDVDVTDDPEVAPAVQFLGPRGFFESFDADPAARLSEPVALEWARTAAELLADQIDDLTHRARALMDRPDGSTVSAEEFESMLVTELDRRALDATLATEAVAETTSSDDATLTRGDACQILYRLLSR